MVGETKTQNLSLQIKFLREKCNLSQHRFGKKVGVSGKSISSYETGRCTPTIKVLEEISKVYNVNLISGMNSKDENLFKRVRELQEKVNLLYEDLNASIVIS